MNSVIKTGYRFFFSERMRMKIKKEQLRLKGYLLKGNSVECNCCGKTYKSFLPFGNKIVRENALCPNCGSLERTRMLLFYFEKETNIFESDIKVLHIAPEDGLKKIFKKEKKVKDYINGDINPNYADEIIDITDIQYDENTFDFVICSHVLGHIPDELKALKEIYRVLKPDGTAIILTLLNKMDLPTYEDPKIISPKERLNAYGESDLLRLHGNDFRKKIERVGFKVQALDYTKILDKKMVERFRLSNTERGIIFLSVKNKEL